MRYNPIFERMLQSLSHVSDSELERMDIKTLRMLGGRDLEDEPDGFVVRIKSHILSQRKGAHRDQRLATLRDRLRDVWPDADIVALNDGCRVYYDGLPAEMVEARAVAP